MKTLFLECNMGAAGDMMMAALVELIPHPDDFIRKMNNLGLSGVTVRLERVKKCGVMGSSICVEIDGHQEHSYDANGGAGHHHVHSHPHNGMHEINHLIDHMDVPGEVKKNVRAVYELIAQAESQVHGVPAVDIHFHEVGTLDALVDITGVCLMMNQLQPDRILSSAVTTGFGQVHCAHGILPVPAPATALILTGIPTRRGRIEGELCTPTGAALIKHFVQSFEESPVLTVGKIGYGMGKKDFEAANCVRALWGTANDHAGGLAELSCNLDDMTPEAIGYAEQVLFANGALEVFATPIQMKKSRPAAMLTCLCHQEDAGVFKSLMFKHTTTAGVREKVCKRHMLEVDFATVQTEYGPIKIKIYSGSGIRKIKPEFDDVSKAAEQNNVAFEEVSFAACREFREQIL